ncbi:nuclear transport factor 2 family protein [Pseudorhodoplanes sp.]|uniref:nuclear transport factor 2 family protein n=1 Tax=Pseudorhodoplanes sp. TaxID=1934341 RepID=UPI003D150CE6
MANELENVAALREAYARWHESKGGSVDHWMELLDDNVSFGSLAGGALGALPFATFYDRRTELRGYFEGLLRDWEMIYFTAQEFVAQGDAVVMRGATAWRNRNTGKTFATPKIDFWRFRNGRAIEFYEYFDTAGALQAAR